MSGAVGSRQGEEHMFQPDKGPMLSYLLSLVARLEWIA